MKTYNVPDIFQPKVRVHFPSFQLAEELEWQAWQWVKRNTINSKHTYLPVLWCPYYVNNKYATARREVDKLRKFLAHLPKKPMVTVNIYDGWPVETDPNLIVFSASGLPETAEKLPLICDPHPGANKDYNARNILCSMVCSAGTHPVRQQLIDHFSGSPGYYMKATDHGGYSIEEFRSVMQKSVFAMAPRGSGKTSFRLYEALQYGTIPVYVSDHHWLPFEDKIDWSKLAVVWPDYNLSGLENKISELHKSGEYKNMQEYGKTIYDEFFTYEGCFKNMKEIIERKYQ